MFLEDFTGHGRGGNHDAELAAELELEDRAVGLGQAREVSVEVRVEGEEVAEEGEARWARWEVWAGVVGLEEEEPCECRDGEEREEEEEGGCGVGVVVFEAVEESGSVKHGVVLC